ncbi:hypothetical protein KM176_04810 [Pseudooceanicola sp. CBS1P-1]|uniref:Uncharacterized protein n=1 Tax=Pseudooceanicola albus TaxID=2692189 RepID=A0A6L7FYZ9_9RHOB|nr:MULTISPECIES: hypothetical protein [Pseudooceanicola]MBT9383171.1 hypothetical protein [Pseudooceanicola endophyticus]MXN16506.1 hypothetical protein [Pseudooceanicola albus]
MKKTAALSALALALALSTAVALPALAYDGPVDTVTADMPEPVTVTSPSVGGYARALEGDIDAAIVAALQTPTGVPGGITVATTLDRMDIESNYQTPEPDYSGLRGTVEVRDANGVVLRRLPIDLRAEAAPVVDAPANAVIVPPSLDSYYAAMVKVFAEKAVGDIRSLPDFQAS